MAGSTSVQDGSAVEEEVPAAEMTMGAGLEHGERGFPPHAVGQGRGCPPRAAGQGRGCPPLAAGASLGRSTAARAASPAGAALGRGSQPAGAALGRGCSPAGTALGRGSQPAGAALGRGCSPAGAAMGRGSQLAGAALDLIAPGVAVLDLGCAPGAWLQVACQNLGPLEKGGVVVGVDVKKVKVPSAHCDSRVRTVCADVMVMMKQQARAMSPQERGFSVILSDRCPVVSGITTKDAAISCELGMRALSLAVGKMKAKDSDCIAILEKFQSSTEPDPDEDGILRRGGSLVIKFLENEDNVSIS